MSIKNIVFIILATFTATYAAANKSVEVKHFKDLEKISLKCYVELMGGTKTVVKHFNLPKRDRDSFESKLLSREVSQGRKTRKVYKVIECAELGKKFKDSIAQNLYKKINVNR